MSSPVGLSSSPAPRWPPVRCSRPPRPRPDRSRSKSSAQGFIFGASLGNGILRFQGTDFRLRIGGISAGATIGASGTDLVGTAYHLHQPADIEGIYSAIGAGLSIAGGRSAAQLTNARGVLLKLHGRQMGLMFSIDLSGMSIALA